MVASPLFGSSASTTARLWAQHLLCTAIPLLVLTYVIRGPHPWFVSLIALSIIPFAMWLDHVCGRSVEEPPAGVAAWPFDALLIAMVGLQIAIIVLATRMMMKVPVLSFETVATSILVGANTGYSAIVVAHELVHRRSRVMNFLGRFLMATSFYEHFSTEHVRGHHARVATEEDPATARYGETFGAFWRRTIPAQFRSAWRIEAKRLGDADMKWSDPGNLQNTVLHGVIAESLLAAVVAWFGGLPALVMFFGQAFVGASLLESVNYFEHYGLRRAMKRVRPVDSWDSDAAFTRFGLVGLSRHADHHAHAVKPFQTLRLYEESPKLPEGYVVMALMVIFANRRVRTWLEAELERRQLGPFAPAAAKDQAG
jgi:alkane 1-monooxygenase